MSNILESLYPRKLNALEQLTGYANRRSKRQRLAEVAVENANVVDELLNEAKRLLKAKKEPEAKRLVKLAERLVNNNRKYQNMVGDFLSNAD